MPTSSVPLVPGWTSSPSWAGDRSSYPKPKMTDPGLPSNPTARCVEFDFFERVVALAKKHDIFVVHDLAYADIVFE